MKISLELPKVLGMLDIAARFVSKNSTLPILQNIYLKASIDTLLIRATDMEKYVELELPCAVQIEGAVTVNAKTFLDILKTIDSETVEFSVDQKTTVMTIKTSKDTFDINGIPASEYVALPEVPLGQYFDARYDDFFKRNWESWVCYYRKELFTCFDGSSYEIKNGRRTA